MLHGSDIGTLELRAGPRGRSIRGRFPYNSLATIHDGRGRKGGRPGKERFAPKSFKYTLDHLDESPVHLLAGHSYDKPLASTANKTLSLFDSAEALTFEAELTEEVMGISWVQDLIRLIQSGLSVGLSPGFKIPPPDAVPAELAEKIEEEHPSLGRAIIRTILQAVLYELSIVTRPAYQNATVDLRSWQPNDAGVIVPKRHISQVYR